ncbi:MAG: FAD-dependent oxidoreductase [Alphaproteobacteria bacterium]
MGEADAYRCDVLVIGSGASGLTAAAVARELGLDVLVVEKAAVIGGTTALSEGMIWIPANSHAKRAGVTDSPASALAYIANATGNFFDRGRAEAYVEAAPAMLDFVERRFGLRFALALGSCDYMSELGGACHGGRAFDPEPFDGRKIGGDFGRLRTPLATTMIFGGMTITGWDLPHFLKVGRSIRSTTHVARTLGRYVLDRLCGHSRGTRLGGGNALIAHLLLNLRQRGVPIWTSAPAIELVRDGTRIAGAVVAKEGRRTEVRARRAVVLACGGFPASEELKRQFYPHVRAGKNHARLAPDENTGDGLRLAEAVGGLLNTSLAQPASWAPVSLVPQRDGSVVPFPHFIDRNKPGFIIVNRRGRRFVNESDPYHLIVQAMVAAAADEKTIEAFVIGDHPSVRRYSLGVVPPAPGRLGPHIRSRYLTRGKTLEQLAVALGIDPGSLVRTVARFNDHAARGADPDFGRGQSAYNRASGDKAHGPNPALGPLTEAPYYAVRIVPAELGTFFGIATNRDAQVLDGMGAPIPGLYAVGNDAASVMGGAYPGAGITIGPAMTFGYVAAHHIRANATDV